jgi:hypothetical protein
MMNAKEDQDWKGVASPKKAACKGDIGPEQCYYIA